jgi:hypothetical protein
VKGVVPYRLVASLDKRKQTLYASIHDKQYLIKQRSLTDARRGLIWELSAEGYAKKIWLTVKKNNSHSIRWYSRMGFINTASLIQDIGKGFVMDDYRMEKTIGQQAPTGDLLKTGFL